MMALRRSFTIVLCVAFLPFGNAKAEYCQGVSRMACYPGIDNSGRTPGALYDAAAEALREANTPEEKAAAHQAMKDAFNPAMQNQRAVICNKTVHSTQDFAQCMAGVPPNQDMQISVPCSQRLSDGKIMYQGGYLPAGSEYHVKSYAPQTVSDGWSYGVCAFLPNPP
jgi:hypothetical protein